MSGLFVWCTAGSGRLRSVTDGILKNDTSGKGEFVDGNKDGDITTNEIIKESNYYPFGLEHKGYNSMINGVENNYMTYNGKELDESLGLNWIDYGARNYDASLGRWLNIDPMAKNYMKYSNR